MRAVRLANPKSITISDEELRGRADEKSWEGLERFGPDYMSFMNQFADALHKENLTLTVFIGGCCGWKDPNTTNPAGHCADAVATHDFCGATCLDWRNSSVDWVLSGATYSGAMRNSPQNPRGVENLKALVSNAAHVIGTPKYGIGMKGGLSWNGTSTPFGDPDRELIDWWHAQGVKHLAKFMDEPRSQAEWDMWGYHLHGASAAKSDDLTAAADSSSTTSPAAPATSSRVLRGEYPDFQAPLPAPMPSSSCDPTAAAWSAAGDGETDDTEALQKCIDGCKRGADGRFAVVLREGKSFVSGSLNLTSGLTLVVDGALLGSTDPARYPIIPPLAGYGPGQRDSALHGYGRHQALLSGWNMSGVKVTGSGVVK